MMLEDCEVQKVDIPIGSVWEKKPYSERLESPNGPKVYAVVTGLKNRSVSFNRYTVGGSYINSCREYQHDRYEFLYYYSLCENETQTINLIKKYITRELL